MRRRRRRATLPVVYHHDWSEADGIAHQVLAEHGGVAHISAFKSAGLTKNQVAAIFRRGVLERPRNGWYVDPALPWQVKRAVRVGGVAACITAAALWALPVPHDAHKLLHVHVEEHGTRLRHNRDKTWIVHSGDDPEVLLHRRVLTEAASGKVGVVDALLQLAWCAPIEWLVVAIDAALHRPLDGSREPIMSDDEYERFVALLPKRFHEALDLVDPSAESPLETLVRIGMVRRRIGPFVPQFRPSSSSRVDFLVLGRLIVEADGRATHDAGRDAIRDAEHLRLGYRTLRFGYDEIVFDIEGVLDRIEGALRSL